MRKRRSSFRSLPFGRLDIGLMRNVSSDAEVKPGTLRVAKNARILRGELTNVPGWRKFSDPGTYDLFDSGAGGFETDTGSWVARGTNTIEVSTDKAQSGTKSLKTTFVDDAGGSYLFFVDSGDLIADLIIGEEYHVELWAAVNSGSVDIAVYDGVSTGTPVTVTSTSMVKVEFDFIALSVLGCFIGFANMGAGEIIYIDDISIWERYTHLHFDEYPMKSGTTHFMTGTVGKIFYWDGTTWVDISGAVTFTGAGWSSTVFPTDDLFIITNKVENIQKWNGTGNVADLAAAAPKCGVVRVLDKHVVALDITNEPQKVQWCELDDSSNWTTGESGSAFIDDTPDFIVGAEPLGTDLIVYKDRGIYAMSYIGAPLYMRILRRVDGVGLVGKDAVLNLEDRHIIFGPDSLWAFNGVRPMNIGGHFMPDVLDAADPSKLSNARLFFLEETDEILVMVTSVSSATGYPDLAWRYNHITHAATGPEDLPAAAVGYFKEETSPFVNDIDLIVDTVDEFIDSRVFSASFPLNIFSNASTKNIEKMGVVYGREGVDVGMELGFPVMDVVMLYDGKVSSVPELLKRIKGVSMRFAMAAGDSFSLSLGVSDEPTMTSMTWKGPYTISPPSNKVIFRAKGRYFTLSLTYTGQNKVTVEDIRLLVKEAGPR